MASEENKPKRSPKGVAQWPHLSKPSTNFNKDGTYEVDLILDPADPEVQNFVASLEELRDAKCPGGQFPVKEQLGKDKKTPTGMLQVKFRSSFRPALFDSRRNPLSPEVQIGSGSVIRVAYTENVYEAVRGAPNGGVNCYLQGVQVLELVEYVGKDAESLGFEEEEGYEVEPGQTAATFEGGNEKAPGPATAPKQTTAPRVAAPAASPVEDVLKKIGLHQKVVDAGVPMVDIERLWDACKKSEVMFKIRVNTLLNQKG